MVDFNNEATVSTPAGDVVKILILQRRNDFIDAVEAYTKQEGSGVEGDSSILKSRLLSLYMEIQPALERAKKQEELDEIQLLLDGKDYQDFLRCFFLINRWLDHTRLIRIDTKKSYDRTIAELENKSAGL